MSPAGGHLAVRPELCDRCGLCVRACARGHLRVGGGYIYVDASECDGCFACVEVCDRGAIVRRGVPKTPTATGVRISSNEVPKVIVGSRAEAKALRRAAEAGEREQAKAVRATATAEASARRAETAFSAPGAAHWNLRDAAIVGGVLLVSLVAKEVVLRSEFVRVMPPDGQVVARALVLGIFWLVQFAVLARMSFSRGSSLREAFRLKRTGGDFAHMASAVGVVVLLLLGTMIASVSWGAMTRALGWNPPASETLPALFGGGSAGLALAVLMVVVVGPVAEELVFRGVIATSLFERYGTRIAVLGSATVFALYHVTPWVFVPRFVLGCALAWLALSRRTLWPAIVLHALHNGVVVGAAFWLPPT